MVPASGEIRRSTRRENEQSGRLHDGTRTTPWMDIIGDSHSRSITR